MKLVKSLYQMNAGFNGNEESNSIMDELHQLDQTVPANLAAAAAAAAVVSGMPQLNRNLNFPNFPGANQQQTQQQQQSSQIQALSNQLQSHHLNLNLAQLNNNSNVAKQLQQLQQQQQQLQQGFNPAQFNQQQQQPQQFHPSFLQLALQQNHFGEFQEERFSRKVFVGGLPPDIDEDEIVTHFRRYGNLIVDWPHKAESKSYFPPKGYAFLIFQEERSVQELIETCVMDDGKLYMVVSSPSMKDKPVQIRPWCLADSDFVMDGSQPLDPRKTIFVGGVPRPLKASKA